MTRHGHICGLYFIVPGSFTRQYLPQVSVSAHAKIVSSTSRTTLTQTFVNPKSEQISELRYTFPLYDGVSVVGFVCTINDDRVIRGVVKERAEAKKTYQDAIDRGETAGLLEQLPDASDVFTTTVGNVPANATLKVDITYLGELKHDAEVDGIRFTIPTQIAPRYGSYPGDLLKSSALDSKGISIVVDIEMPDGSNVKNVQSPSHPIAVTLGNTSAGAATGADMSLQKASATLALATAELGDDFVLQVVATNTGNPIAVLETHPTIPNHRALMATLVPKFNLPSARPEIVFLCDRSGSMGGNRIQNLKVALQVFLKSLPVGVKFNICSFGSRHEFLFPSGSQTYDASSLEKATRYVDTFKANFGGTEIRQPMEDVFKKRYSDMDLEVFLLTDGEIWNQEELFAMMNQHVAESKGAIRVFTLGIGQGVSHALIEGVAAAGNGFSQAVGDNENMNSKVVRMLKASLAPHIKDYTLEVKYHNDRAVETGDDDDFEIVEKVIDALTIDVREPEKEKVEPPKKTISLFDPSADLDSEMTDAPLDTSAGGKYSHVPPVSEPKLLQAPFVIPPLYPFSRTSVYLLLSPETAQKQPKSVILRGTSPVGPVELEIPVTVLLEKGETIHQLAARKAVKELEEGRGWIYHAKASDAALLKKKYPGRFTDMVEREAVRLGVTYQVGGKWCSFVAIEGNQETSGTAEEQSRSVEGEGRLLISYHAKTWATETNYFVAGATKNAEKDALLFRLRGCKYYPRRQLAPHIRRVTDSVFTASPKSSHSSARLAATSSTRFTAPTPQTRSLGFGGVRRARAEQDISGLFGAPNGAAPPPPAPAAAAFGSRASPLYGQQSTSLFGTAAPAMQAAEGGPSLFGLAAPAPRAQMQSLMSSSSPPPPPPPPPPAPLARQQPVDYAQNTNSLSTDRDRHRERAIPEAKKKSQASRSYSSYSLDSVGGFGAPAPGRSMPPPPGGIADTSSLLDKAEDEEYVPNRNRSPAETLNALVALQSFSGSWTWNVQLLTLLGLEEAVALERANAAQLDTKVEALHVLATGLVLVYLELRLGEKRDEWEMLADKAREWLQGQLEGGVTVEKYLEGAKKVLIE